MNPTFPGENGASPARVDFEYHLANVTPQQAFFLGQICALFADPARNAAREQLEAGRAVVAYDGGRLELISRAPAKARQTNPPHPHQNDKVERPR